MSKIDDFKNWRDKNKKKNTIIIYIILILVVGFGIFSGKYEIAGRVIKNNINEVLTDKKEDSNYQTLSPKSSCEKFIEDNSVLHSYTPLQIIEENPEKEIYIYYTSVCYGEKHNCEYNNVYISTKNSGLSWDIEF